MAAGQGSTRDRVLDVAMRLFGEQGYAATTIAQIEAAAGLSPGSGALYRHFRSKQALLEAGVSAQLEGAAGLRDLLAKEQGLADLDLHERLVVVLKVTIARLERGRHLVHMVLRDYRAFPDLMERLRDDVMLQAGDSLARWLAHQPELADAEADWSAVAAVAVASSSHYWLLRDVFDTTPFGVDEPRYLRVLADLMVGALQGPGGSEERKEGG